MTKLKKLRLAANLTQRELAERLNFNQATVSKQEKQGITTLGTARNYAAALNCHPEDLLEKKTKTDMDTTITRNIGDIVYLKSGGPAMVVIELLDSHIVANWFDVNRVMHTGQFPPEALTVIQPQSV